MRRPDLIIPYTPAEHKKTDEQSFSDTITTALPMAAMFTRHKMVGWASVIFAIQSWLNESAGSTSSNRQPAIFGVGMGFMSLIITYMPIFFPPPGARQGTGTAPAQPAEPNPAS